MSEQINKVLVDRPQSFNSSEQAQARDNIGAMAASASSEFAPASAGFSGVSANNYITGDGTTSNPIGLSSKVKFETSLSATVIGPNQVDVHNHVGTSYIGNSFIDLSVNYNGGATGFMNASSVRFTDSANNTEQVDASSIQRWNGYSAGSWNESGNPLSTGFGGSRVSAASQYNDGPGNWACRTVRMSGIPDQNLYGFQTKPNGTATYGVNAAGAFLPIPQQNYYTYLMCETDAQMHELFTAIYPTGLTSDARLDFVNLSPSASANITTDNFHGATSVVDPGQSATMWYMSRYDWWTDGRKSPPAYNGGGD